MSTVALVRCDTYQYEQVKAAVQAGFELLGGAAEFAKAGEKILLKPNWLTAEQPGKCVTTHPMVFKAVCELLLKTGARLSYGDSPAFGSPETAAQKTGFSAVAAELGGISLADFHKGREIFYQEAIQNKRFTIANGVLDSDGVISLPKLKTHGLMRMTGSIKNQFGCIPGVLKGEFHVKIPDVTSFARMLVDLNSFISPRLYIMDGIMGMEGNGPRGGRPKKMNILLFSTDPVALDAMVCRLVGLDPEYVPTIIAGATAGRGTYLKEEIDLLGEPARSFTDLQFDVKREPVKPFSPGGARQVLGNAIVPKPYITARKCVGCGICTKMCPVNPKALDWHDGDKTKPPFYMYERCIRCYCCQELCPESAIGLRVPLLRKFLGKRS